MKKSLKIVLGLAIAAAVATIALYQLFGLYVSTPGLGSVEGETILYYRRYLDWPFLLSPDSLALMQGESPSDQKRLAVDKDVRLRIAGERVAKFAYSRGLYLRSTKNRDFLDVKKE